MKKQYILVALALIGLGVISTMAFTLNAGPNVQTEVYDISDEGATGSISKIKAKPQGSLNKTKIVITISGQTVNFDLDINLLGSNLDLTDATITGSSGIPGTHVLSSGTNILYFEDITGHPTEDITWTVTIDDSSDYGGSNTVWEDITSLLVTLADN